MKFTKRLVLFTSVMMIGLLLSTAVVAFADDGAKYVFMFIGDGMASSQIGAAEAFLAEQAGEIGHKELSFTTFPAQGMQTTYAADRFITGSAPAATAMASGVKTNIGYVGVDIQGESRKTIAEMARDQGMKVGIVSSVTVDHATPAAYYAHVSDRGQYYEIGQQMANSDFDYIGGGKPRTYLTPEGKATIPEIMENSGWTTINVDENREQFENVKSTPIFAYQAGFASGALEYAIDRKYSQNNELSLADFTRKGIEVLDNPNGFFMMVEGGKIDWAGHANDAAANIHDTLAFDSSIKEALEFYAKHPQETLILVTGDHECGGLTLGWAGTGYQSAFKVFARQKVSYEWFNKNVVNPYKESHSVEEASLSDLKDEIEKYFGLTNWSEREKLSLEQAFKRSMQGEKERSKSEQSYLLYGGYEPLTVTITHLIDNRAGVSWTSYSHTGVPVPVFAKGVNQEFFNGYYDNTDIYHKLIESTKIEG